jgi:hypothetical protein
MTYEIYCDQTNEIINPGISNLVQLPGTLDSETGVYTFDKGSSIITSFLGCPITSFEIESGSKVAKMVQKNCSTNPCRDIIITGTETVTTPETLDFTVKLTAKGGSTLLVDQKAEIQCSINSTVIEQIEETVTYMQTAPLANAEFEIKGYTAKPAKCAIFNFTIYDETCSKLYDPSLIGQPPNGSSIMTILDVKTPKKYDFCVQANAYP